MTPVGAVLADVLEGGKGKKIKKDEDVVENRWKDRKEHSKKELVDGRAVRIQFKVAFMAQKGGVYVAEGGRGR